MKKIVSILASLFLSTVMWAQTCGPGTGASVCSYGPITLTTGQAGQLPSNGGLVPGFTYNCSGGSCSVTLQACIGNQCVTLDSYSGGSTVRTPDEFTVKVPSAAFQYFIVIPTFASGTFTVTEANNNTANAGGSSSGGSGNLNGTLTAPHIPVATGTHALGNSSTTDDGTTVTFVEPIYSTVALTDPSPGIAVSYQDLPTVTNNSESGNVYDVAIGPIYTDNFTDSWADLSIDGVLGGSGNPPVYSSVWVQDQIGNRGTGTVTLGQFNDILLASQQNSFSNVTTWCAICVTDQLGNQTTYIGLHLGATNNGTINTFYGIKVDAPGGTVTNGYSFVSEPGTGNFGIGTITPSQALDVNGNIQTSGALMSTGVAFGSLPTPTAGMDIYCSDCQVTTAATCSTASPTSCVCKGSGTGAFAKYMNYQGGGANWYCQ